VDHFSGMSFVYLQKSTKGSETLEAKKGFESFAKQLGVTIHAYHADNGRFAEELFIQDANQHGQTMSYCGVGAHFQNGLAEERSEVFKIRLARCYFMQIVDGQASSQLTCGLMHCAWRMIFKMSLLRLAAKMVRHLSRFLQNPESTPNFKHFKPFGCPAYVLQRRVASWKQA
jgi:hypothetical protein